MYGFGSAQEPSACVKRETTSIVFIVLFGMHKTAAETSAYWNVKGKAGQRYIRCRVAFYWFRYQHHTASNGANVVGSDKRVVNADAPTSTCAIRDVPVSTNALFGES